MQRHAVFRGRGNDLSGDVMGIAAVLRRLNPILDAGVLSGLPE